MSHQSLKVREAGSSKPKRKNKQLREAVSSLGEGVCMRESEGFRSLGEDTVFLYAEPQPGCAEEDTSTAWGICS